jgi:hypothetical protein
MLAAGLRELFILGEDYVSMVAGQDELMWQFYMLFVRLEQQADNQAN